MIKMGKSIRQIWVKTFQLSFSRERLLDKYQPGEYLGLSTVGRVNLTFPSGSCGNSMTYEIVILASVFGGRLPRLHWKMSPAFLSSFSKRAVYPFSVASLYVSLA